MRSVGRTIWVQQRYKFPLGVPQLTSRSDAGQWSAAGVTRIERPYITSEKAIPTIDNHVREERPFQQCIRTFRPIDRNVLAHRNGIPSIYRNGQAHRNGIPSMIGTFWHMERQFHQCIGKFWHMERQFHQCIGKFWHMERQFHQCKGKFWHMSD